MRSRSFRGLNPRGFHRLHYTEWGRPGDPVVVCVHGLSQNARSFDALAERLATTHHVACLDVVGRGKSGWLSDATHYDYAQYMADANGLIARLGVERVDWVGTSMGGLIGMMLAALPDTPIQRLVLNDIGPFIPRAGLARIGAYMKQRLRFDDMAAFEAHLREVYQPFGPLSDDAWAAMASHGARRNDDGTVSPSYDPAIGEAFRTQDIGDIDLWPVWDMLVCSTLVLRGAESDILLRETAADMSRRGPAAKVVEFAGIGHAPALQGDDQVTTICDFLAG